MRETIGIPEGDRFILVASHSADEWFIDPNFPGMNRSEKYVLIHITLSRGRTVEQKQALYARIAERWHKAADIPSDDVMIVLSENNFEDWSFGKGQAQYVLNPPAWARKAAEPN
jgi:phenylpyruvate tautomerase PptA (4-oxalocrotonate tautomerase family)